MQSILYLPASDGTANASLMTVQTVRSPGATAITVNTVSGVHTTGFHATMGAPHTFTDPITGETITIISDATAVDFAGHINAGQVIIDAIAPGYVDTRGSAVGDIIIIRPTTDWSNNIANVLGQSHNADGSIKSSAVTYDPNISDYIQSGGVWTALTGFNASMTALVAWQAGFTGTVAAIASRTFTASKDTYVDVLRTVSGFTNTFTIVYTEVANGATTGFALAANSVRLAKVVTGASGVTSILQYGVDGLNNPFKPTGANSFSNIDVNGLFLNVKSASNTTVLNPVSGSQDFGSFCRTQFTVASPCMAFVTVSIGMGAAGDSEFHPQIYMDGALAHDFAPGAGTFTSSARQQIRSTTYAIPIATAGAHIISAGIFVSAGGGWTINVGGAEITALVLGKVTA